MEGYNLGYYSGYVFILIGFVITMGAQLLVKGNYSKYKKIDNSSNSKGYEVARKILDANGLKNIKIKPL